MKRNKRILLLLLLALLLLGWSTYPVQLLTNKQLIDLQLTIKDAPPGYQGNPGTDNTGDSEEVSDSTESDDSTSQTNTQVVTTTEYSIKITNESVVFENVTYDMDIEEDVNNLKSAILSKNNYSARFVIIDAYAEAHIYRKVLDLVQELSVSEHVFYSEKAN